MCGILGHYRFDEQAPPIEAFPGLLGCLSHRGPDDSTYWSEGRFTFGHRRLSIIDLAGGRQPMATPDGALVVTFNGEIYNYLELRTELMARGYHFATESDTEVLLHGYREWGSDLLPRLIGMFAFGIADRRQQELFLARDRFGEKPLLCVETDSDVMFASELRPLSIALRSRAEVDLDALGRYLCLNYVPGEATLLRGVRRVPPGSWVRYSPTGVISKGRYWSPPHATEEVPQSMETAVAKLEALLDRSVALTLRSDVPVGVFLSAGIDSSLVARSAIRSGRLARAFCLGFEEASYSEAPRATALAAQLGIPATEVTLTPVALEDFFNIVSHADDPLADSSALAVWTLAREAARHVKVVLSGDGGDELFGGYLTHRASLWHGAAIEWAPVAWREALARGGDLLRTGESKVSTTYKLMRFLRALALPTGQAHFSWNGVWLPVQAAALADSPALRESALSALEWMSSRHGLGVRPPLGALQRADLADYLPNDILSKGDRMSMAHGLEVRAPLLEVSLAEFALRLPAGLKAGLFGHGKRVLRELSRRTYGIDVAHSKKQGFSIPIHAWLRGPARDLTLELLSPASIRNIDALNPKAVTGILNDHLSGRRSYGFELWGLMVLVAWHRGHIQQRPAIPRGGRLPERLILPTLLP